MIIEIEREEDGRWIAGVAWMERSLRSVIQVPPAGRNDDLDLLAGSQTSHERERAPP